MRSFVKFLAVILVCSVTMYFFQNLDAIVGYFAESDKDGGVADYDGRHPQYQVVRIVPLQNFTSTSRDENRSKAGDVPDNIPDQQHQFYRPHIKGVISFDNVCIERDPKRRKIAIQQRLHLGTHLNATRNVLVVYNAHKNVTKTHKVGAHPNVRVRDWEVIYKTEPLPQGANYISSHVAYFMTTSCDGNLWLFFEDAIRGLHAVIKKSNRLHSKEKNIVYYREPLWEYKNLLGKYVQCWDPKRFEKLLLSLNLRQPHDTIHKAPVYTCYKHAVLGAPPQKMLPPRSELAAHIVDAMGIDPDACPAGPVVTLLQRKNRVVLNMDELRVASQQLGFNYTVEVVFEDMNFEEQMRMIRCTDVLVGVQGAGLAWGLFLRKGTSFVEIAWPKNGWHFLYAGRFKNYNDIQVYRLEATKVLLNFDTFSLQCKMGKPLSVTEKHQLASQRRPIRKDYNQWKWADAIIDPASFKQVLHRIKVSRGL